MADLSLDLSVATSPTYLDLLVLSGDLVMTSDLEAGGTNPILQGVLQALKWISPEWFLDILSGIPWFQEIFVKNPDISKIDTIMINTIQAEPGVLGLTKYLLTPNFSNRSLALEFSAQTSTGTIYYNGILDF